MRSFLLKKLSWATKSKRMLFITSVGVIVSIVVIVTITSIISSPTQKDARSITSTSSNQSASSTSTSLGTTDSSTTTSTNTTTSTSNGSTTTIQSTSTTTEPPLPSWHNVVPSTGVSMFSNLAITGLSCPTLTFCVATAKPGAPTVGNSVVYVSNNFGESWSTKQFSNQELSSLTCLSSTTCLVVGEAYLNSKQSDVEYRTTDSGQNWQSIALSSSFFDASIIYCEYGTQVCLLFGGNSSSNYSNSYLAKSTDGGLTWMSDIATGTMLAGIDVTGISCLDQSRCVIAGYSDIYSQPGPSPDWQPGSDYSYEAFTIDGGQTWTNNTNMGNYGTVYAVRCPTSGSTCWMIVAYPSDGSASGTSSWAPVSPVVEQIQFSATGVTVNDTPEVPSAVSGEGGVLGTFLACNASACLFPTESEIDSVTMTGQPSFSSVSANSLTNDNTVVGACVEDGPQCLILGTIRNGTPQNVEVAFS